MIAANYSRRFAMKRMHEALLAIAVVLLDCSAEPSQPERVSEQESPLFSVNAPTTVTAETPVTLSPTCPGHRLPDQCGSWAGVELSATVRTPRASAGPD